MKKLLLGILISLFMVTASWGESVVETVQSKNNLSVMSFAWTTNTYGSTTVTSNQPVNGYILMIETVPSSTTPPTNAYDVSVTNSNGFEVIGDGDLQDRSLSETEAVMPILNSDVVLFPNLGSLTVAICNTGPAQEGTVNVYYRWDR